MACRLIALDKQPGVRPVGIGEIYRRLWAKCILKVTGMQATAACDNLNLCAGLPAGIEGAVHAVREVWESTQPHNNTQPGPDPDRRPATGAMDTADPPGILPWADPPTGDQEGPPHPGEAGTTPLSGVLLVDAKNGFNELSRKAMLWTTRHLWANGSRFAFNCYRHSSQLLLRRRGLPCLILLSREGVTQGDPLSMVLYGLTLTPLAASLRKAVPSVVQPWYADDAAMAGPLEDVAAAMRLLQAQGPARGYYPEPDKSVLISDLDPTHPGLAVLSEFNFRYAAGHRYVGGFIGSAEAQRQWLAPQIQKWAQGVESLARVATRFPQTAYAGLVKSLQSEWQYLQRVSPGVALSFAPVEAAITSIFLPALLDEDAGGIAKLRAQLALPVRLSGIGLPNPVATADQCYQASKECTADLTASLQAGRPVDATGFAADAGRRRKGLRKAQAHVEKSTFEALKSAAGVADARRLQRATETGAWLTAMPNTLNGTDLSADEFKDNLRLRLGLCPTSLPHRCEGCNERFTVEHAMSCAKGGLVLLRHNDIAAEWTSLCAQALSQSAVSAEPLIHSRRDVVQAGATGTLPEPDLRGDVGVHGFWAAGTQAIFDVRVTDTDAPSQRNVDPAKILKKHERAKKAKYNDLCLARRRTFTPLVFSVDGLLGVEASAAMKRLATLLTGKWHQPYSQVAGYVRSRLSVALARSTSRCLRADRCPPARTPEPAWESGAGLGLYR